MIGQRTDKPLQKNAPRQIKIEGVGNMTRTGIQLMGYGQHGRHDHIAGHVSQKFKKSDCKAKAKKSGRTYIY